MSFLEIIGLAILVTFASYKYDKFKDRIINLESEVKDIQRILDEHNIKDANLNDY